MAVFVGHAGTSGSGGMRIQTGHYTGSGKSGSGSKNSITFELLPRLVYIVRDSGGSAALDAASIVIDDIDGAHYAGGCVTSGQGFSVDVEGTTITWYSNSARNQMDMDNALYFWVAIG